MKGYFSIDLIIDKNDQIKIIDPHGFGDAISFTERAGYTPRKERIHKFMSLLKDRANNKKIIHLVNNDKQHILSDEVKNFYKSLPDGIAHLEWINEEFERDKTLRPNIMKDELLFFDQAAKAVKADFHPGWLMAYSDELWMEEIHVRTMMQQVKKIPYKDIGLIINWGSSFHEHPHGPVFWTRKPVKLPVLNSSPIQYVFSSAPKSVRTKLLSLFTDALLDEIYVGMAQSSSEDIAAFVDKYESFVYKPVCTHSGVDIRFLSKSQAMELSTREKSLDQYHPEIRIKTEKATEAGFTPNLEKIDSKFKYFNGYFANKENKSVLPLKDMGSYILQERIEARPFKSTKTGLYHTGNIRAQILFGQPIGVMHRFSTEEYNGTFQNITSKDTKTFWERTDEKLEQRIVDFLVPILTDMEDEVKKHESSQFLFYKY